MTLPTTRPHEEELDTESLEALFWACRPTQWKNNELPKPYGQLLVLFLHVSYLEQHPLPGLVYCFPVEGGAWLATPPLSDLALHGSWPSCVGSALCILHDCTQCGAQVDETRVHALSC